jgi:tRNA/rRNA methyltransferase
LRRNPTEAERKLWHALTNDRRFASHGFKRQTPVGRHVTDVVSFPLRLVIDLVPGDDSEAAGQARRERRTWLEQRGYRVVVVQAAEVEADAGAVLERIMAVIDEMK